MQSNPITPQAKVDHSVKAITKRTRKFLSNCHLDGWYETEYAVDFWSRIDTANCLAGERKLIGSGSKCRSVIFTGKSLLVNYEDEQARQWWAWIHS